MVRWDNHCTLLGCQKEEQRGFDFIIELNMQEHFNVVFCAFFVLDPHT